MTRLGTPRAVRWGIPFQTTERAPEQKRMLATGTRLSAQHHWMYRDGMM